MASRAISIGMPAAQLARVFGYLGGQLQGQVQGMMQHRSDPSSDRCQRLCQARQRQRDHEQQRNSAERWLSRNVIHITPRKISNSLAVEPSGCD